MQLWKKMKKNRKGFTLVEIIVVLVILAILAAFTIPAMLGFVNDARGKASIAEAREVYVAAQSSASGVAADNSNITGNKLNATGITKMKDQMITYIATDIKVENAALAATNITIEATGTAIEETKALLSAKVTKGAPIYVVTGSGSGNEGRVTQVIYLDQSSKYVCSIKGNASGNSSVFFEYAAPIAP